jgi:hypothetical protein
MNKEAVATLIVYLNHMQDQIKHGSHEDVNKTIQKAKRYIKNHCDHETINAGDDEHIIDTCTLCGWIQPPYDNLSHTDNVPY